LQMTCVMIRLRAGRLATARKGRPSQTMESILAGAPRQRVGPCEPD
jgi:hypothetical protein